MRIKLLGLVALLVWSHTGAAWAKPKLAVMTIRDRTRSLGRDLTDSLTDALRTQLAQTGRFVVIDKSRQAAALKRLVVEQKRQSYRSCYDSRCQIPLGQALAADSILRTSLTQVGSNYLLMAELVDLAKEAVTGAAQARVRVSPRRGRDDRLLNGISLLVRRLSGRSSGALTMALGRTRPAPAPGEPPEQREARLQAERERREQLRAERAARRAEYRRKAEERRQQRAKEREERNKQARIARGRAQVERSRRLRRVYGWMAIVSGGVLAATGAYYMTAKVSEAEDSGNSATSPDALKSARDDANRYWITGIVVGGLGTAALGAGLYLVLSTPAKMRHWKVGDSSLELDRAPSGGPTAGGFALSWGGRF